MKASINNQFGYLPRWGVLLIDLLLCSTAFWLSVWVGSGFFHYLDLSQQIIPVGIPDCDRSADIGMPCLSHLFGHSAVFHIYRHAESTALQYMRRYGIGSDQYRHGI